ncbi:MAG: hypothetical protein H7249_19440 [Chitinophagaceae bacterium]|nr:hypothetical protein [Oligoflexus sp.]
MNLNRLWAPVCMTLFATNLHAQTVSRPAADSTQPTVPEQLSYPSFHANSFVGPVKKEAAPLEKVYMDYFEYKQRAFSSSENISLGDRAKIDSVMGYWFSRDTSMRFRMDIDPDKYGDTQNNTSRFNLRLFHRYDRLEFQADLLLDGDKGGHGGTSIGPDTTSKESWIAYRPWDSVRMVLRPYDLGTEIGQAFRTLDVARVYYINGTPAYISNLPIENESIRSKTVGGLEVQWVPTTELTFYAGVGSTSFFYPTNSDFSIEQNAASESWKAKEDRAYKAGIVYKNDTQNFVTEYATHMNSAETGALLDSALSLQYNVWMGNFVGNVEWTASRAGTEAYRLGSDGAWFQDTTPFRPVYSDYYGKKQDWLGKTDSAELIKAGWKVGSWVPYVSYKHRGQYFIDRELESAHKLRTADETASHGGLNIYGVGGYVTTGKFIIQPEVEFMQAKNAVFGSASDIREDRVLSVLKKDNTVFTLTTRYSY